MAGIITNVDSDIQKLRNLKNEIESVKKALKGVDVKVDIDIAANLEDQLRSLTVQYDELAGKIAEIEGKIALSTKNINDSTEKIIKAQQSIMEASKAESQISSDQTSAVATAQVSTIQVQAQAYEELKDKIDEVLGSRAENIKRLIDEENHIKRLKVQIADLVTKQAKVGLSENEMRRLSDLNNDLIQSKAAVSQLNQILKNDAKIGLSAADSMSRLSQELGRMRMAYRELTDEEKSAPFGQTLKASIEEADRRIKELDASIGNHQRNVGNYASSWNGLSFSIQQLARELPSLAYGPTIFFSAISNNLPILADEIKRARIEYNEMVKAGQKGVPVWKQVAKSVFSWQTLMVAGITILTMYGSKIIEWVGNLLKGSDAALSAEKALKKLNDALDFKDLGTDVANFQKLVSLYRDLGDNAEAKKKFIEDYKDELNQTGIAVNNVAEADRLLKDKTSDFESAMERRARATAALKLASEEYAKSYKKQAENAEKIKKLEEKLKDAKQSGRIKDEIVTIYDASGQYKTEQIPGAESIQKEIDRLNGEIEKKAAETFLELFKADVSKAEEAIKEAGLTTTDEQNRKDEAARQAAEAAQQAEAEAKAKQQAMDNAAKIILEQQKANQDTEIALMGEGTQKKLRAINIEYERQVELIKKKEAEVTAAKGGSLTNEDKAVFSEAKRLAKQTRDSNISGVLEEDNKKIKDLHKEYQSLLDKYIETQRKFNSDRAMLKASGASGDTMAELDYQEDKTLDAISLEMIKQEGVFKSWMNSITDMTLQELQRALMFAKIELDIYQKQNPNSRKVVETRGKVAALESQIANVQGANKGQDINDANKSWQDLYRTLNEVSSQFKEIGDSIGGTVGKVISSAGEISAMSLSMINNISEASEMFNKKIDSTASRAAKAIQQVERASVILAIVGAAVKIITKIVNLANEMHDAKHEKNIQKYQEQIDGLEKSYEELGDAIERAYSKTAADMIAKQNKLLEQQKTLIALQMKEEEAKKKTDKNKVKEWEQQLEDINKVIEENKEKAIDAIHGEDIQSAIDNFADAYADAMASSEDGWISLKDTAKEMMKKMVMGTIKEALNGSKAIENLRESLRAMYEDNIFTQAEQDAVYKMAADIQNQLDSQFGWAEDLFKDSVSDEQKATYGGFENMSEETGSELNGRFTALQMAGEDIRMRMIDQNISLSDIKGSIADMFPLIEQSRSIVDEIRGMLANSILELQGINENTSANVKELKRLGVMFNKWDGKIMNL